MFSTEPIRNFLSVLNAYQKNYLLSILQNGRNSFEFVLILECCINGIFVSYLIFIFSQAYWRMLGILYQLLKLPFHVKLEALVFRDVWAFNLESSTLILIQGIYFINLSI